MAIYGLIVGINYYNDPLNKLNGCINDMKDYEAQLLKYGVPTENIVRISDDPARNDIYPSKANIMAEVAKLQAKIKPGDTVFISYSGHGTNTRDVGKNETDGKAEATYTADGKLITDDEFYGKVLTLPKGAKALVVMDCCHSASMLDLRNGISKIETKRPDNTNHGYVVMLSGCQDNQTSADYLAERGVKPTLTREFKMGEKGQRRYRGALTASLMDLIDKQGLKYVLDTALSGSLALMRVMNKKLVTWLKKGGFDQVPNMAYEGALPKQARGDLTHAFTVSRYPLRVTKARAENFVDGVKRLEAKIEEEIAAHRHHHEASEKRRSARR
ncbi:MAG: caspase family protein [Candidatus Berkiella sp.]